MSAPRDDESAGAEPVRRYELLMKLATGGMATVYLGYQRGGMGFRQIVAIKRPHAHLVDDPAFRRAFLREANLASKIRHANVVDVRDVDASEESIDLVMEYVQGASLATLMEVCDRSQARIGVDVALRIALDSCAGLHAAHELTDDRGAPMGLVHRDVAPQNILIGEDGVARVTDFGIAKCVLTGDPSTWQGTLKGRLAYMAPEYVAGQPIDRRADVFALGVVLWEMLSGKRLFRGSTDGHTMANVLQAGVPVLDGMDETCARALHAVLVRTLEKDPERRFRSMVELSDSLEALARDQQIMLSHARVSVAVREHCGAELQARQAELRDRLDTRPSAAPDLAQRATVPQGHVRAMEGTPTAPASYRGQDLAPPSLTEPLVLVRRRRRATQLWILIGILAAVLGVAAALAALR